MVDIDGSDAYTPSGTDVAQYQTIDRGASVALWVGWIIDWDVPMWLWMATLVWLVASQLAMIMHLCLLLGAVRRVIGGASVGETQPAGQGPAMLRIPPPPPPVAPQTRDVSVQAGPVDLDHLTVNGLNAMARSYGLRTDGLKVDLIGRLERHFG
jgi:hypothetical protein